MYSDVSVRVYIYVYVCVCVCTFLDKDNKQEIFFVISWEK